MAREDYLVLITLCHSCQDGMLWFLPLTLDSKAGTGLAIPVNPKVEHTTINKYAGLALDPKAWNRVLGGVRLISRSLFH